MVGSVCGSDLANDYEDFAASIQGLGYLESGITEPLARLETSMLDFAQSLRTAVSQLFRLSTGFALRSPPG